MKDYDDGYDEGYNDRNQDGKNNENATSISVSDSPIFDPITTTQYCRGELGNNGNGATPAAHYVSTR